VDGFEFAPSSCSDGCTSLRLLLIMSAVQVFTQVLYLL